MAFEFPVLKIGDVCEVGDGAHAKVKRSKSGVLYLTSKNIGRGELKLDNVDYISSDDFERLFSKNSKAVRRPIPGDVLIGIIGTFGNAYLYKEDDHFGVSSAVAILRPNKEKLDSSYLYHVVTSRFFQDIHGAFKGGSVQGYTNIPTIKTLPIPLPPIDEQKAIAAVLSAFDDKIELNRQMNATLEAMARALFKSWFVDFDPVRRNAAGGPAQPYDHLFPGELVTGEDGRLIPAGWRVGSLSEVIQLIGGGTPKTSISEYWNGNIPWFSVKDVPADGDVFVVDTEKKITEAGVANSSTRILPTGTTIISARGTVGKLALVGVPMAMNQSCYGIRGARGYPDLFTYFLIRTKVADLQQQTHGTVFDTITQKTFETIALSIPSSEITCVFDQLANPLMERIKTNIFESRTLADLRDTLLPRLLSGQLRVPLSHPAS